MATTNGIGKGPIKSAPSDPQVEALDRELGVSGITIYGGVHWNVEDYNPDLQNQNGMHVLDKMRNDTELASCLFRITAPIESAEWAITPAKKGKRTDEIADFVRRCLFEYIDFTEFLHNALLMLPFGCMCFEKVWGVDKDGFQCFAKLAPRMPKTFWQFNFDEEGLIGLTQRGFTPMDGWKTVTLPRSKVILFTWGKEGENFWGRSILRPSFMNWSYKQQILWVDAAGLERFGLGVLEMHATESVTDPEKEEAEKVAREFRSHERQFLHTSHKYLATFHYPPSGESRAIKSAEYHDQQMSRSTLQEWANLGASHSGSRAVAETKKDFVLLAYQGTAKNFEDTLLKDGIKELVDRNFGPQEEYPRATAQDLTQMSGDALATILEPLAAAKLFIPDKPARAKIRKLLDFEEEDPATLNNMDIQPNPEEQAQQANAQAQAQQNQDQAKPGVPADKKSMPAKPPSPSPAGTKKATEPQVMPNTWRAPFPQESSCAFADMTQYLDTEPKKVWARIVSGFKDQMIRGLARQASKATDQELAGHKLVTPFVTSLARELQVPLTNCYMHGRQEVLDERRRQALKTPVVTMAEGDYTDPSLDPEFDPESEDVPEPTQSELAWIKKLALGFSAALGLTLAKEAADNGILARNSDLQVPEQARFVQRALDRLSQGIQLTGLTGVITQAFTNGRNEQALALRDQIETAYYSAIMDDNTCEFCEPLDGAEHDPEDDTYATPNPDCKGAELCRCITVYVFKEDTLTALEPLYKQRLFKVEEVR